MEDDDDEPKKPLSKKVAATIRDEVLGRVGYAHPPQASRFKKGRSGNPNGRPRKAAPDLKLSDQPVLQAARRAAAKKIKLREGDQTREVPAYEALMEAAVTHGIKGNARYAGMAMDYIRQADEAHAREVAEDVEFWSRYKSVFTAQLAEARRTGTPEPTLYPHPDDVVIDHETGVRLLGPLNEEQDQDMRHTIRTCEVLLMQDELDHRSTTRRDGSLVKEPGTAFFMFNALNRTLPSRVKLQDSAIVRLRCRFERLSKRALLKELFAGWRSIGKPKPRGYISPDMTKAVPRFVALHEFAIDIFRRKVDISSMSFDETTELILDRLEERVPVLERKLRLAMEQARSR